MVTFNFPYPFLKIEKGVLKIEKSALILEKKDPGCVRLCFKFSIQKVIFRVSRRKNSKSFPCSLFCLAFDEMFIEVL